MTNKQIKKSEGKKRWKNVKKNVVERYENEKNKVDKNTKKKKKPGSWLELA